MSVVLLEEERERYDDFFEAAPAPYVVTERQISSKPRATRLGTEATDRVGRRGKVGA